MMSSSRRFETAKKESAQRMMEEAVRRFGHQRATELRMAIMDLASESAKVQVYDLAL
jgi:hypothetical protein